MRTMMPSGALLGVSAGCATLSLKGERVRTTTADSDVKGCKLLGEVSAPPPYVGPSDAEFKLRNQAADLGADVVLMQTGVGSATGRAFDCGGRLR
jgi:hypothetical protein